MRRVFYLTHPQVTIDPGVPVPHWSLSATGLARAAVAGRARWARGVRTIVSSDETKAVETAAIIGATLGIAPRARADMHENDRSATGFLEPAAFEAVADAFFAAPDERVRGWESARAAQARIVAAAGAEIARGEPGDLLFVGHGAVGTLLMCHLLGETISRAFDQPAGGGHVFSYDATTGRVLSRWRALEDDAGLMLG